AGRGAGVMAAVISATLVKELRDRTGAGMMDCKRALQETDGDIDAAVVLLREKGMAQAAKRAGRETTEGKVGYRLADDGSTGTMVAVGCETEPVSNNEEFLEYAKNVLEAVEAKGVGAEREIFANSDEVQGKPEQAREKIVEGMLNKRFFGANVLVDQEWIHDSSKTVGQALKEAGGEVLEFEVFALQA